MEFSLARLVGSSAGVDTLMEQARSAGATITQPAGRPLGDGYAGYFQDPLGRANEFGSSIMPGEGAQSQVSRPLNPADVVDLHLDRMQSMAKRISEKIQAQPGLEEVADKVEIRMTSEGLEIQLLEDSLGVFFEVGGAAPSLRGRQILALVGHELSQLPNPVLISGFTDSRRYVRADGYSNWELSTDRANTARRILMVNGVQESRINQVRGFADRELHDPQDPFAPSNRRVTITMLFSGSSAPVPQAEVEQHSPSGKAAERSPSGHTPFPTAVTASPVTATLEHQP